MDTRLIAKNAAALGVSGLVAKAISAIVGIWVTRYLGPGSFGDYSIAYAYVGSFILFTEMGISQLMVQEGARDEAVLPKYFGNALLFKALIAILVYFLMLAFIPAGYSYSARWMIVILGIAVGFNAINQTVYNYYQATQEMYLAAFYQFLNTLFIGALTVGVIYLSKGVVTITVTHLISYIAITMLLYLALKGKVKPRIVMAEMRAMVISGLPFGIHRLFYNFYFQISILVLSLICTNVEVGVFSAAYKLVLMLIFLPSLMTSAIYPVLYQLGASDQDRHRQTEEKVFKLLSAVGIPCSTLLCVLAAPITIWLYKGAFGQAIPILMIVSWFLAFECMSFTLGDVLTTTDRQWQRAFVQGTALIGLYVLTKLFYAYWGIFGAAYAIMVIEVYIFIGYYILVRFGVYKIHIFRQLPLIIASSAAMGFFAYLLRGFNPLLVCCLAGIVYLGLMGILDQDFRKVGIYLGKRSLKLVRK